MGVVMSVADFKFILPEMVLTGWALLLLLMGAFARGPLVSRLSGILCFVGSLCTLYLAFCLWGRQIDVFNGLYTIDDYGTFFKAIFLIILALVTIISIKYSQGENAIGTGEYYSLLMFGVLGMMVMVSSHHFITIFIGLEVMSLSIYILCGLMRSNLASVEASLKYFLLGAFATAFLLYGMALIYGSTGIVDVVELKRYLLSRGAFSAHMFVIGIGLLIVGFGFKIAAVPFHMWTPDVYQGAPTPITAYMATGVKAAAFAVLVRIFYTAFIPFNYGWSSIIWLLAVITMCVGNITALVQRDVKRLLAYSSIAHAGYILVAFATGNREFTSSILYYLMAYAFMNVGAFTVVIALGKTGNEHTDLDSYAGLGIRQPFLALCMSIFLLSLAGIPPLAGFMGKFYVFGAAVKSQYYWLAVIGVLNSAIAAFYYLRIMVYMYFKESAEGQETFENEPQYAFVILVCVWAILHMGIFPRSFMTFAQQASRIFL
jgi:NADH-quinone oxidoreductase subunit N